MKHPKPPAKAGGFFVIQYDFQPSKTRQSETGYTDLRLFASKTTSIDQTDKVCPAHNQLLKSPAQVGASLLINSYHMFIFMETAMADDFYSVTIPGGHCFMIKGVTNAGAGQRFDAHIPGHTQIGIAPMPVPARTQTVTGGGYPNNKPMNPPIIKDSTTSALPISIEFFKHYGGSDWRRNTRWRVLSTGSDVRIIGQEDGADNDYNDTVVTISWTPCAGLVGNDAKQIDAAEGLKNITVRIDEIEERLRNVEATAGAAFSLSANSEPDMSADT